MPTAIPALRRFYSAALAEFGSRASLWAERQPHVDYARYDSRRTISRSLPVAGNRGNNGESVSAANPDIGRGSERAPRVKQTSRAAAVATGVRIRAETTHSYKNPPGISQGATNGPSSVTSLDGFGRPAGMATGTSIVATGYDSCTCSPTGKDEADIAALYSWRRRLLDYLQPATAWTAQFRWLRRTGRPRPIFTRATPSPIPQANGRSTSPMPWVT
jgi:hypothetical protein